MKHFQTYESFLNESTNTSRASWDPVRKVIDISNGTVFAKAGIRCIGGRLESFYDGMGRSFSLNLKVLCRDEDVWIKNAPAICDELNKAGIDFDSLISTGRSQDEKGKQEAIKIIKKYI